MAEREREKKKMKSPRLYSVVFPTLFCSSVILFYIASDANRSLFRNLPASIYDLSMSDGGDSMGVEDRNGLLFPGNKGIGATGESGSTHSNKKKWQSERKRNVLPPGVSLNRFTAFMNHQIQGEEGSFASMEQRIVKTCEQHHSVMAIPSHASYKKLYHHLLYEPRHRLVYCPVWKAMSTSWDAYLLQMAQEDPTSKDTRNTKNYEMAGNIKRAAQARFKLSPNNKRARNEIEDSSCSVMIVRHPFQRLVSAYRDKMIARNSTVKDYLYLRTVIKHRYRNDVGEATSFPTFHEFVDFVLDEWSSSDPRPGAWHEWSRDWHPAYYICDPCHMNYTHILRYEHYKDEVKDFRQECHLEDVKLEGTHHHQLGNTSSAQVEDELYGQLSYSQVVQLAQMYFIDLAMFGYNISVYLQFARPD